ncbi:hypothetical protein GDO81_001418 [Engystomops pustulosus]|uniref:Secreted protein n=1 Tax=Engystomops pustulosus TaxID=76066 RepID=A0AAV7DD83_ENGPU|nr:hypothetical protein GDO81_001418 [Engystomops pustulosus]
MTHVKHSFLMWRCLFAAESGSISRKYFFEDSEPYTGVKLHFSTNRDISTQTPSSFNLNGRKPLCTIPLQNQYTRYILL